jgi:hypothetical protein
VVVGSRWEPDTECVWPTELQFNFTIKYRALNMTGGGGGTSRPCRLTMKECFWCPSDKIGRGPRSLCGQCGEDNYQSTGCESKQAVQTTAKLATQLPNNDSTCIPNVVKWGLVVNILLTTAAARVTIEIGRPPIVTEFSCFLSFSN